MPRRPWIFVVAWTIICAIPVVRTVERMMEDTTVACVDMCDVGRPIGALLITVIVAVWLAVVLLAFRVARQVRG
jgi:hypothetical protein